MSDEYSGSPADNLPVLNPGGKGTRHRHPAVSQAARETFLEALSKGHAVEFAAELAGLKYARRLYELRQADQEFAAEWADAWAKGNDALVEAARDRAVNGYEEPIVSGGKVMRDDDGSILKKRIYSDRLMEQLLAARIPAFRRQATTTLNVSTGADGVNLHLQQKGVSFEDVMAVLRKAGKLPELEDGSEAPEGVAEVVSEEDHGSVE